MELDAPLTELAHSEITGRYASYKARLIRLWQTTGNDYYRDIYSKAYGESVEAAMAQADAPDPQEKTYQLYTQAAKAEEHGTIANTDAIANTERTALLTLSPDKRLLRENQSLRRKKKRRAEPMGFLELPAEIRNDIYRYAFNSQQAITGRTKLPAIGLLRASKQIHQEASSILYGENTFRFKATIDYQTKPEIHLEDYPDTRKMAIWPSRDYHEHLRNLHIQIAFNGGEDRDFNPPPIFEEQVQAMRDAYDVAWDNLDLTIEFLHMPKCSFTTFWLKHSIFRPLRHPKSTIELPATCSKPKLTRFLLEHILHWHSIDTTLSQQESDAFAAARDLARQSHETGPNVYGGVNVLASRMAHGDPDYMHQNLFSAGLFALPGTQHTAATTLVVGGPTIPVPPPAGYAAPPPGPPPPTAPVIPAWLVMPQAGNPVYQPVLAPIPVTQQFRHRAPKSHFQLGERLSVVLGNRNPRVTQMLMEDAELRIFAAREFPALAQKLIPKDSVEITIMIKFMNLAAKFKAENESLKEALKAKEKDEKK